MKPHRLMTIKNVVQQPEYSWLTEAVLRRLIFNSKPQYSASGKVVAGNGLAEYGAIIRIGKKILIDLDAFDQWIASKREFDSSALQLTANQGGRHVV
ncbi:MAG: hypothetical protein HYS17_02710 [Micavibrio aeruginosavorus]|uniref:Uncharacterized protein n=1 Tax=Micavibrio aeruginosavorus TaxID=349221 RepID=A0A7T5R358_9BACT|nr:MAG: hypothetical protein HYS17_02710 [Micavibrio aeruginosavorus]